MALIGVREGEQRSCKKVDVLSNRESLEEIARGLIRGESGVTGRANAQVNIRFASRQLEHRTPGKFNILISVKRLLE